MLFKIVGIRHVEFEIIYGVTEKQKMFAEERRRFILDRVKQAGSVSVAELTEELEVSDMTIRRDLESLSARKLLQKVHGGAVQISKTAAEPHFTQKQRLNQEEKQAIARIAAPMIEDGHTVAFSAGTTTWNIANTLQRDGKALTFITNSTNIALTLQEKEWDQIVLSGGSFRTPSDALVGPFAEHTIKTLNADVLFLGVHGIHPHAGLTTPNIAEAEINRCLVDAAQKVVVVADHTKVGVVALAKIGPLSRVDVFVTDEKADSETLREIELAGVQVVVAET